jgi:hypothetical protein
VATLDSPPARLRARATALGFAGIATVLGFLPIVNWLPGGHSARWYPGIAAEWVSGSAIVIGVAFVLAIVSRRIEWVWRPGACEPLARWAHDRPVWFALALCVVSLLTYTIVATAVFSRVPISVDELVQLIQARTFAGGRLWLPASATPEFYSVLNVVDLSGRYYAQFPPGGPAMLTLGVLAGVPWLVGPVCGAVSVAGFWSYVRVVEPRRGVAVGAALLFAVAPFSVFMAGSHMNHVPTLMWLVLAMAAMARVMSSPRSRPVVAFANGLALGCAAAIRPVDALAFALPAAVWYLVNASRDRARWRDALAVGAGVAIPLAVMMWVNARTTGAPLAFGYQVLWGRSHDLGFHRAPWGLTHTPVRGLELINLYFLRLQTYLFEASIPSLVPFLGALCLTPTVARFDRYLLASAALVVGSYFAYWHDGFTFGPRFVFTLLPMLALWTARFPGLVRDRFGAGTGYRATWYGYFVAAALALVVSIPARAREYAMASAPMRLDYLGPARRAGVEHALIFVRESWGAQLMARMWALGIPRSETETLYGHVDACLLEERLGTLERAGVRDTAAFAELAPLLADSTRIVRSPFSPDVTERYLPGTPYSSLCAQRVAEDRLGFTLLAPLLSVDRGSNIYARDMHARNLALIRQYPERPVYLMRPPSNETGAQPMLYPLRQDSLLVAWRAVE